MNLGVLVIRVVLSVAAAWLLLWLFFDGWGIVSVLSFAALLLGASYIVEWMKRDRMKEQT